MALCKMDLPKIAKIYVDLTDLDKDKLKEKDILALSKMDIRVKSNTVGSFAAISDDETLRNSNRKGRVVSPFL